MDKEKFLIKGLAGFRTLEGEIPVGGAKNAALKVIAASLLFKDDVKLKNVPNIEDIKKLIELLQDIGFGVVSSEEHSYTISPKDSISTVLSPEIAKKIRSSVVLTGPLLARTGRVVFPHPGGCIIGARPIDLFLKSYELMGAKIKETKDKYIIEAKDGKLVGAKIFLRVPSVTVTETIMMAGVLAKGVTTIRNAALEPEIEELAKFLNKCGANIQGAGTSTIIVRGGPLLKTGGVPLNIMPDRIEAGSFLILAALAGKDVTVTQCNPDHIEALIDTLRQSGVKIDVEKNSVRVTYDNKGKKRDFQSVNIKTHEYPGFPTDLQAPMTVFLTQTAGESLVHETIFEGRLAYAESLEAMGADITPMDPHRMLVKGATPLHGKDLESPDLRAGLAFVLAAIVAKGNSTVHNVYNIDRGYESVEKRFAKIGVDILRVAE